MSTIWGQHASKLSTFMKNASSPIDCNLRRCHFHRLHFLYRLQTQQLASWNVWQGSSLVDALTGRWQVDGVSFADRTPDGERTRFDGQFSEFWVVLMHRSIRRLIFLGIEDAHHKFLNSKRLAEHLSCFDAQIPLSLFDLYRQIFYCRCIAIHFCFFLFARDGEEGREIWSDSEEDGWPLSLSFAINQMVHASGTVEGLMILAA